MILSSLDDLGCEIWYLNLNDPKFDKIGWGYCALDNVGCKILYLSLDDPKFDKLRCHCASNDFGCKVGSNLINWDGCIVPQWY